MKWKRIIGWMFAGLAALLIIAAVGGYLYLKTSSFQRFAINEIVDKANSATGGRTEIGGFDLNLGALTAHLYNITVHGTELSDQPPLLHADKLTVSLRIISALHRKVTLRETAHRASRRSPSRDRRRQKQLARRSSKSEHRQQHQCVSISASSTPS